MHESTSNDFSSLINLALSTDAITSKNATKVITSKYRYRLPEKFAEHIFLKFDHYKHLSDVTQPDNFLRILNVAIFSKVSAVHKNQIISLTLEGLQYNNGTVRESARKLVNNFPFLFDHSKEYELQASEKLFIELLITIEKLLKQYQHNTNLIHLENAPPSIYKTLALTWHDVIMKYHLWEKLNYLDRMVELNIP